MDFKQSGVAIWTAAAIHGVTALHDVTAEQLSWIFCAYLTRDGWLLLRRVISRCDHGVTQGKE